MTATPLRVLLVDDDEGDALLVSRYLAGEMDGGSTVERVASVSAAVERLAARDLDLLLLNRRIGPDDGLELLRELRARGVETPAILLTGNGDEAIAVEAMKAGAADLLAKGQLAPAALGAAVRYALERHRNHQQQLTTESALRESEARYRRIFEQALTGNYVSLPGGRIVACNPAFVRMFGFDSVDEVLAAPAYRLYPDPAAHEAFLAVLRESGCLEGHEIEMRRRDGSVLHVLENVMARFDGEGRISEIHGSALDITERKLGEEALRASEARALEAEASLRSLIDNAALGIYRSSIDGRFLSANPALVRMLGYESEAELLALDMATLYGSTQARRDAIDAFRRASPGEGVVVEWRRRDGATIELRLTGRIFGTEQGEQFEMFAADVTDRRRAEEALRRSEDRYRQLFESNPQPMWVYDRDSLRFLAVNDATVTSYGYSREELLRMTIADIRPREDVPRLLAKVAAMGAGVDRAGLWRHRRKDGTLIEVEITSHPIEGFGCPAELVLAQDVTERRSLEEQLRRAQRLESLGRLAGGVAHDFNNYLGVIAGYAELVRGRFEPGDPLRGWLDEILFAAERAAGVTRQLLAFGKKQVVNPQPLDLEAVLEQSGGLLRRLLGEDVELEVRLAPGLGRALADRVLFEQVVVNLAVNARDAMPEGGRLLLAAENVELDEEYAELHPGVKAGRYVLLSVTDSGTGMDEATLARIFEPFFTTKEAGKGTGLGLSTVYGIVHQSGGQVTVYSEPGRGTTFRVYLPRTDQPAEALPPPGEATERGRTAKPGVPSSNETVLLVEDDDGLRRAVGSMLRAGGFRVLEASGAAPARALVEEEAEVQILVSDVMLRDGRGPELANELRRTLPGLRVLFVSGYADDAQLLGGLLPAGQAFLAKPFGRAELVRAVRALLDGPFDAPS